MCSGRRIAVPLRRPVGRYAANPSKCSVRGPITLAQCRAAGCVKRRSGCSGFPADGVRGGASMAPALCLLCEPAYSPDGIRCRVSVMGEAGEGACGPLRSPGAA